jgi:glycosyltransferase involved in cell wall biosynthesis
MSYSKKPDILLLSSMTIPHYGGLSTHLLLLLNSLNKVGFNVELSHVGGFDNYLAKSITVAMSLLKLRNRLEESYSQKCKFLENSIKKFKGGILILHAHNIIASVAAIGKGSPIISTIHGPMYEHARESGVKSAKTLALVKEYEKRCFDHSDFFIAVDHGQKELLVQKGVPENKIKVIPNAVDVDSLVRISISNEPMFKGNYFIMSRRLVHKNGPLIAIRAFLSWVGKRDFYLIVAGDGRLRDQVQELVTSHKYGNKVILVGSLNHEKLLPLTRQARASVVPSIPFEGVIEATSLSALESLALDVPVIASRIGGLAEIDHNTGYLTLVPPGDEEALKSAFEFWATKDKKALGNLLSSHVREHFGVEKWINEHLEVYKKVQPEIRRMQNKYNFK